MTATPPGLQDSDDAAVQGLSPSAIDCRRCGKGQCPFDQHAAIPEHNITPAVERLASLAGGVSSGFEKGAELLDEMSGVDLSESTIQRITGSAAGQGRLPEMTINSQPAASAWYALRIRSTSGSVQSGPGSR